MALQEAQAQPVDEADDRVRRLTQTQGVREAGDAQGRGRGRRDVREGRRQRARSAVAWDRAAAKARACRTTAAPSAASETRTDRSSLLEVPV